MGKCSCQVTWYFIRHSADGFPLATWGIATTPSGGAPRHSKERARGFMRFMLTKSSPNSMLMYPCLLPWSRCSGSIEARKIARRNSACTQPAPNIATYTARRIVGGVDESQPEGALTRWLTHSLAAQERTRDKGGIVGSRARALLLSNCLPQHTPTRGKANLYFLGGEGKHQESELLFLCY